MKVRFFTVFRNTIYQVMLERGWEDAEDSPDYDFAWLTKEEVAATYDVRRTQQQKCFINHFQSHTQLSRKDLLAQNVQKMQRLLAKTNHFQCPSFKTIPTTFVLPENYFAFERAVGANSRPQSEYRNESKSPMRKNQPTGYQKMNPAAKSQSTIPKPLPKLQKILSQIPVITHDSEESHDNAKTPVDAQAAPKALPKYIVKPCCLLQGQGIFIATPDEVKVWYENVYPKIIKDAVNYDVKTAESIYNQYKKRGMNVSKAQIENQFKSGHDLYLIQKYIENPLLINGHKFDCRVYVLVKSFRPLNVYICNEGFARFALTQYTSSELSAHLTNVAIQKQAKDYDSAAEGAKWGLFELYQRIKMQYGQQKARKCQYDTETCILRTLQTVATQMTGDTLSFEVYGFDVMFTDVLQPQICEVNASPSLTADTDEDIIVKKRMLNDALSLVVLQFDQRVYGCFHQIFQGVVDESDFDKGRIASGVLIGDARRRSISL